MTPLGTFAPSLANRPGSRRKSTTSRSSFFASSAPATSSHRTVDELSGVTTFVRVFGMVCHVTHTRATSSSSRSTGAKLTSRLGSLPRKSTRPWTPVERMSFTARRSRLSDGRGLACSTLRARSRNVGQPAAQPVMRCIDRSPTVTGHMPVMKCSSRRGFMPTLVGQDVSDSVAIRPHVRSSCRPNLGAAGDFGS